MDWKIIILFFGLQLVNVMLNTAKTLIMARTNNPHASAIINAITFGFYTAVVKQIATLDLPTTITVTVITNVIGVYVTYWIVNRMKKDSLWKVEVYGKLLAPLANALTENKIGYVFITPEVVTIYCYTQAESAIVSDLITNDPSLKYNITEITKRF